VSSPASGGRGDQGARLTPYELALPAEDFEGRIFPAIAQEAASQGLDPARREHFHFLGAGGKALEAISPDDAPAEAREQLRAFLYHAFNFWSHGRRIIYLEPPLARYLVESAPTLSDWEPELPGGACYLQLPPNLFWAAVEEGAQAEPVDGMFVTTCDAPDPIGARVRSFSALLVLGIRGARGGFGVIEVEAQTGPELDRAWLDAPARPHGRDFESTLPGGEMAGLYSLLTGAEALKLLFRALRHLSTTPGVLVRRVPDAPRGDGGVRGIPPTSLPWHSLRLEGGE
jgi:hypothetical protein